jgi:hypothetical protein
VQLAVQASEVNVFGHSDMYADILLKSVCWLIYKDLLSVCRLEAISSALKKEAPRSSWSSLSMAVRMLCEQYLPWKPANLYNIEVVCTKYV